MADDRFDDEDDVAYLYEDVLATLIKGESISTYDIDSLVDVYDYAYDLSDEYVTGEVMACVLARSPRCMAMLERKAIKLLQLSESEGAKAIAKRMPEHSFIRKLVLAQLEWDAENWRDSYKRLFKGQKPRSINDFGAMCMIDLALGVDDPMHLVMQLQEINDFLEYPVDYMVDLSLTLYERGLFEGALAVLQELTIVEPFDIDHWLKLAEIYDKKLDNPEEAQNALDYALAIDPKSAQAKIMFGELSLRTQGDAENVLGIAESLIGYRQFKSEALYLKAGALIELERNSEAMKVLEEYLEGCPNPFDIFILLFSIMDGELNEYRQKKFVEYRKAADAAEIEEWLKRVKIMLSYGAFNKMIEYARTADLAKLPRAFRQVMQRVLYREREYGQVIKIHREFSHEDADVDGRMLCLMARLRRKEPGIKVEEIDELLADIIHRYKNGGPEEFVLQMTFAKTCFAIKDYIENKDSANVKGAELDEIDPFYD